MSPPAARERSPQATGVRAGLLLSALVTAFSVLTYWGLRPLHERGQYQPVLGFFQGLEWLLQAPGAKLGPLLGVIAHHHRTPDVWLFGLAVNFVGYFLAGLVGVALWRRLTHLPAPAAEEAGTAPPCSRRRFLSGGVRALEVGAAGALGYSLLVEPRRLSVTRLEVPIRGLPAELDGLRLVQITDVHLGPWLSVEYVQEAVRLANEEEPDLACLTGDYVHRSAAYIEPVIRALGELRPRIGTVAVLGNHDWWEADIERMRAGFRRAGVVMLDNDRRVLTPDRRIVPSAETGLALCGVGDLWEDWQDYHGVLGGLPAGMPCLLLSHNPDVAEDPRLLRLLRRGGRVDLMLSGHTHGGQVRFPFVGAPVTNSRYGQKYAQGLVQGPAFPVFVCRGIGVSGLPLRLGAPPEIAVLQLRRV
jgi:predicted MPP superfamily phosphohydrolase